MTEPEIDGVHAAAKDAAARIAVHAHDPLKRCQVIDEVLAGLSGAVRDELLGWIILEFASSIDDLLAGHPDRDWYVAQLELRAGLAELKADGP